MNGCLSGFTAQATNNSDNGRVLLPRYSNLSNSVGGIWTPDEFREAGYAAGDPFFANVVGLWHFNHFLPNGTNVFQNMAPGSPGIPWLDGFNQVNFSVAQKLYEPQSLDFVTVPNAGTFPRLKPPVVATATADFNFPGDYCVECWTYPTLNTGTRVYIDMRPNSPSAVCPLFYTVAGGAFNVFVGAVRISGGAITLNAWTHLALSKVSGSLRFWQNGIQQGSTFADSLTYVNASINIGGGYDNTTPSAAYFDSVRITKGAGRYSAAFTPARFPNF